MSRARLASDQSQLLLAFDFDKNKHGEVVCFYCRCRVRGVRAYPRTVGDERIVVPAYFSLWPNIEHEVWCRYNVEKTIQRFVAYSKAIRKIDRDATPILEKIGQGQAAEFRLHILMEALERQTFDIERSVRRVGTLRPRDSDGPTGTEFIRTNKVLTPYFRTAKGILALAARIQSHQDLAEWIRLKFGEQTIRWEEFFFDLDQYLALVEYFVRLNKAGKHYVNGVPIAIVAKIYSQSELFKSNGEHRVIGTNRVISAPNGKLAVRPVFYFRDNELAERKSKEDYLLVCGLARLGAVQTPKTTYLNPRVDVSIKVVDPRQVCQYTPK